MPFKESSGARSEVLMNAKALFVFFFGQPGWVSTITSKS
jgi:hypothetical protein